MASPLESLIRDKINQGFKGRLLAGTLRRETVASVDPEYGDAIPGTPETYSFNGARLEYDERFRMQAGIPENDSNILIIAGSLATTPAEDDLLLLRSQWFQIRKVRGDPANAAWECQSFEVPAPSESN